MTLGELPPYTQMGTSKQGQQVELIASLCVCVLNRPICVFLYLMCVYVHLCMCAFVHANMLVYVYACMHICMHNCMHVFFISPCLTWPSPEEKPQYF